jgi:L-arabinose transport system substrate-binding protein
MLTPLIFSRRAALIAVGASLAVTLGLVGCSKKSGSAASPDKITLGFIVKQPEEPWFQLEWKFADQAAKEFGFELRKMGAKDGATVLAAIDNLGSSGAQGFVICTPDVRLGPAIVSRAKDNNLKLIAVDDRFLKGDDTPMEDVHYLGISARKIGELVGQSLHAEMQARKWPAAETGLCVVTFDQLATAKERTDGATSALLAAGFPQERIFRAPQKTSDIPGAFDAVNILVTQHSDVKHWLICGMNDSAVMGAVRAMENRGFSADNTIGIGINGTDCIAEFEKEQPTGFFASVLLSARQHGYETAKMLYEWVKSGKEPPLDTRTTGVLINRSNFKQVLKEQGVRD